MPRRRPSLPSARNNVWTLDEDTQEKVQWKCIRDVIHGIRAPSGRQLRRPPIVRLAIAQILIALRRMIKAFEAELAARRAIEELGSMNDHMLRDLGITRTEIESKVRRSRASIGTDYGPLVSDDTGQGYATLPTVSSPDLMSEGQPEHQLQRLRSISR